MLWRVGIGAPGEPRRSHQRARKRNLTHCGRHSVLGSHGELKGVTFWMHAYA